MAVQFIPRQEPVWGQSLSNLLGSLGNAGANIGVAAVQARSAKQLAKQQREKEESEVMRLGQAYSQMLGFSPEQGAALARAPQKIQETMVQQIIERGGLRGMNHQPQAPQPMMGGMQQPPMSGMQQQQGPMEALHGLQEQRPESERMMLSQASQSINPEDPGAFLAKRILGGAAAEQPRPLQEPTQPQKPAESMKALDKVIDQAITKYDMSHGLDMAPSNIAGLLGAGMSKVDAKKAVDETHDYYKTISKQGSGAMEDNRRLMRMEHLIDKNIESGGKLLRGAGRQTLLNISEDWKGKAGISGLGAAIGGVIGSIIPGAGTAAGAAAGGLLGGAVPVLVESLERGYATPETQEFEKLSAEFVRGAKDVFGSRITDADLNAFMKMVPTLSNTDDGKLSVIRNLRLVNEGLITKKKVADKIIRANGGRKPYNLEDMVEEISEPILQKLADDFISGSQDILATQRKRAAPAPAPQGPRIPEYDANEL